MPRVYPVTGYWLRQARINAQMSQEEAARRLGVTQVTISKWESDVKTPALRQLKLLARVYKCSFSIDGDDPNGG